MKIRKCDHCGREFSPQTYKNMLVTRTEVTTVGLLKCLQKDSCGGTIEYNYDICDECYKELRKWLNDEEGE